MLLSSSNRKYQPYPLSYFSVVVCLRCVLHHILSPHLLHIHSGKTGILSSLLLCSLWWVQIVGYVLACRSCSFVCTLHHLIIIIVQTYLKTLNLYNACQMYLVKCVSTLTLSQWSSSGNPVCLELRPQCTLECHWRKFFGSQCASSGLPVVFQRLSSGLPVCSNYAN